MRFEPAERRIKIDGIAEFAVVRQLQENKRRHEGVGGHSANRDFGPDAARLLQGRQIGHPPFDGQSTSVLKGKRPDAEGGYGHIPPAAIGFLQGHQGSDQPWTERGVDLMQFVEPNQAKAAADCRRRLPQFFGCRRLQPAGRSIPRASAGIPGRPITFRCIVQSALALPLIGVC